MRFRNGRENNHKRKFMQLCGDWIDDDGNRHTGNLRAWGEWEPESDLICTFNTKDRGPHHPRYLWKPYWTSPSNSYRNLHNTDPFIFGDHFLYSNCRQLPRRRGGLKQLARGSVIAFGSCKKINGRWKWVLDTVLVVKDSFPYDPLNASKALEGRVPEAFLNVTGGPLTEDSKLKELAENGEALSFRLYQGATLDDRVKGMFSFFPAIPGDSGRGFARPVVDLPRMYFNPKLSMAAKVTRQERWVRVSYGIDCFGFVH